MSRKYETTVPYRMEMINIIRTAYDRGVTFLDAAEGYVPFEVERILGEAIAPFRDKVVITSKFGWNIDLETGRRLPGLNSRPGHIKLVVESMLKRLRTKRKNPNECAMIWTLQTLNVDRHETRHRRHWARPDRPGNRSTGWRRQTYRACRRAR